MKWIDYREKLGIGFDDKQKHTMLMNKIRIILPTIRDYYSANSFSNYLMMVCEESYDYDISGIENSFCRCRSTKELISKYVAFYNTYCEEARTGSLGFCKPEEIKELIIRFIKKSLEELNISFEIFSDEDGDFIFPKGIKEFDDTLVSEVLDWLKDYPLTEKAWSKALRAYSEGKEQDASDVADKFRKALETFFKEFFGNDQTLENNRSNYGIFLKGQGVPKELSNNFESLLQAYTKYMNGYAKHNDKTEIVVLEYLMYQTGNIIRLLITLKKNEAES